MKKTLNLVLFFVVTNTLVFGQNMSINATGVAPHSSAMLDIQSTSQGLLIPRMTDVQRTGILSPENGLMVFQTNGDRGVYFFDGASNLWRRTLDSAGVAALGIAERALNDTAGVHLMNTNMVTDVNYISGDGDDEGISINNNGEVSVTGGASGATNLTVNGMIRTSEQGSGLELSNNLISITGNTGGSGDLRLRTNSTDRLTIDSSGRLGFGTTNPNGDVHIADDTLRVQSPNNFSGTHFIIEGSRHNAGAAFSTIDLRNIDVTDGNVSYSGARIESQNPGSSDDGDLRFFTTNNLVSALAMRIDENGQVGIGTTTPSHDLDVAGTMFGNEITTNSLGINTAPPTTFECRINSSLDHMMWLESSNTSNNSTGLTIRLGPSVPTTATSFLAFRNGSGGIVGSITGNGSGGVNYNTTSDRRLKQNIKPLENSLEIITEIDPKVYERKSVPGEDEFGFIAQELQSVYPQAVSGDSTQQVEEAPMSVDYSQLTPLLTAAIKELHEIIKIQQTEIEQLSIEKKKMNEALEYYGALEQRLEALENSFNKTNTAPSLELTQKTSMKD